MSKSITDNSAENKVGVSPTVVSEVVLKTLRQCIDAVSTMQQKASEPLAYTQAIVNLKEALETVKIVVDADLNQIKTAAFFKAGLQQQLQKHNGILQDQPETIKHSGP